MVSRLKCPECGLVNFASATECKRCRFKFSKSQPQAVTQPKPVTVSPVANQLTPDLATEDSALREPGAANEPKAVLTALPEYFIDEPAPYSAGVILFAATLGLSILFLFYQLSQYSRLYGGEAWKALTNLTSGVYVPVLEPLFYFEWITKALAIFASLLLIVPFLRKSYAFLKWVRVYLIAGVVFILADGWAGLELEKALREKPWGKTIDPFLAQLHWYFYLYGIALLVTAIWFLYFTTSKRVAKTFIN